MHKHKEIQRQKKYKYNKYQMRELDRSSAHNSKTTLAHNLVFLDNKEKGGGGRPIQEMIQIIVS